MSARELVNLTKKRCRQVLRQRGRHRPTKPNSRTCLEESELECGGGSCCWKVGLRNGERCALASFLRSIWSSRPCSFRTTRTSWRSIAASSTLVQGGMRLLSVRATRSAALSGVSLFMASVKWRRAPLSDTRYSKITVGGAYLSAKRYRCERRCLGNSSFRRQSSHVAKYARHSQIMSRNRRSDRPCAVGALFENRFLRTSARTGGLPLPRDDDDDDALAPCLGTGDAPLDLRTARPLTPPIETAPSEEWWWTKVVSE
jgi:hypothetical protein